MSLLNDIKKSATDFLGIKKGDTDLLAEIRAKGNFDAQLDLNRVEPIPVREIGQDKNRPTGTVASGITLREALSHAKGLSVASPSRYRVELPGISDIIGSRDTFSRDFTDDNTRYRALEIVCEQIQFPSLSIQTTTYANHGIPVHMPYGSGTDQVTLTLRVSADLWEKRYIESWMSKIVNQYTSTISYAKGESGSYKKPIRIWQMAHNKDGLLQDVYGVILEDAFPTAITSLDLNYGGQNEYHKLTVTFTFKFWHPDSISQDWTNTPSEVSAIDPMSITDRNDESGYPLTKVEEPEKSARDKFEAFKSKAQAIMKTVKGLMGQDQGLALDMYGKLNDIIEGKFGFRIDEIRVLIEETDRDIRILEDMSDTSKTALLLGTGALLALLGKPPTVF